MTLCKEIPIFIVVVAVQLLSHVRLFSTPWTAECQASLSLTISRRLPNFVVIASVMPSSHLILLCPLLLLLSIFPREQTTRWKIPWYWERSSFFLHSYLPFIYKKSPHPQRIKIDTACCIAQTIYVLCRKTEKHREVKLKENNSTRKDNYFFTFLKVHLSISWVCVCIYKITLSIYYIFHHL